MTPNENHTPLKSFRIPQTTYEAAQAKAEKSDETVSDVVRRALDLYIIKSKRDAEASMRERLALDMYGEHYDQLNPTWKRNIREAIASGWTLNRV